MPKTGDGHPFRRRSAMNADHAKARARSKNASSELASSRWFAETFLPSYLLENREAMLRVIAIVRSDPEAERALLAQLDNNDA